MPFATSPVLVGLGDQVEVRYPTPSTWNTQTTVQVQIGTGNDPDGITFGTRIPDATPENFSFNDQVGYLNDDGSNVQSTFERVSTYYSDEILVTGIELVVPARIEASVSGPKINEVNPAAITTLNAAFRINRGGIIGPWITSGDVQEGDLIRLRVQTVDWYTQTHNVTLFVSDETWGTDVGNPPATRSDTWSITTRAQDQLVNNPLFVDFVDAKSATFGGYRTQSVSLAAVDTDVVLRALATGDCEVSSDNVNWSTLVTGLTSVDTLFTRIQIGADYTTKTTGDITIFAVGGDTLGGGFPTGPENNFAGTYGSGAFEVIQTAGTITDDWQVWTEVDRYPDTAPIVIGPIFKPSLDAYTQDPSIITKNTLTNVTIFSSTAISGQANQSYTVGVTGSTSNINGEGATFSITRDNTGAILLAGVSINSGGKNYTIGEEITILGSFIGGSNGTDNLILTVTGIQDLIYWNVSSPFYNNQEYGEVDNVIVANSYGYYDADPGQYYYSNFDISGLGTEYVDGIYSDLEAPFTSSSGITAAQLPLNTSLVNGGTVQILAQVASGDAEIRKNNTGAWVQQLYVQNGDEVNVRMISPLTFDDEKSSTFVFNELQGGPNPNPTQGPTTPSEPFVNRTFILRTREARTSPVQTRITDVWEADAGQTYVEAVNLSGLDEDTIATAETGLSSPGVNVQVSIDNTNFSTSVAVPKNTPTLYVRATASTTQGFTREAVYSVGFAPNKMFDTWKLTTKFTNYIYYTLNGADYGNFVNYSIPDYIDQLGFVIAGAGGGRGGDEEPSSEGGRGGNGALVRGTVAISPAVQGDFTLRNLRLYSPEKGTDGKGNDSYGVGFTGILSVSVDSSTTIPAETGQTYVPVIGVPVLSTVATNSEYTVIRGTGGADEVTLTPLSTTEIPTESGVSYGVPIALTTTTDTGSGSGVQLVAQRSTSRITIGATDDVTPPISITNTPLPFGSGGTSLNLPAVSVIGIGTNARFSTERETVSGNLLRVNVTNGGQNYQVGDTLTIPGTSFGGISPSDDIELVVNLVEGGEISSVFVAVDGNGDPIGGQNYQVGDVVRISGDQIGGTSPADDTTVEISSVPFAPGSIQSVEPFYAPGDPGTGSRYLVGDQVRISFDQVGGTSTADDIIITVTDTVVEDDAGNAGEGGWGYATGGDGGNAGPDDRSGGGGGGGGAAALLFGDGTPIVVAGGGGGGGGAGNDTKLPEGDQEGNRTLAPTLRTDLTGINLVGLSGQTPTDVGARVGGGGGGAGGGWGIGGLIGTSLEYNSPLETASVVRTEDLDAQGGTSGDVYYDSSIVTLTDPTEVSNGPSPGDNGVIVLYYPPQDLTPLPFSFTQVDGVDIFTTVESDLAQIIDITGSVPVSVSNGQVRTYPPGVTDPAQASAWSNGGTVRNTGYVQVRLTTGASYNNLYTSVVTVGTESATFSVTTGAPPDTDPTGYVLAAVDGVDISTLVESNTVTVSGINRTVQINAFGDGSPGDPEILVCPLGDCTGQSYQLGPLNINNGDTFTIRKLSSPDYSTPVNVSVQVGTQSPANTWTITTRAEPDATPVGFIFTNVFGADLNTEITSVTRIIQGISDPINITVTGGASILRNGIERTDPVANVATATFANLDEIALIYTTSNIIGDTVTFDITAGTYTTQWIVGNSGVAGTTPDPLPLFPTVLANNPGELTGSVVITLDTNNALSGPVGISATSGALIVINGGGSQPGNTPGLLVDSGDTIQIIILSSLIDGATVTSSITIGSYTTTFSVVTPAPAPDDLFGQWYSSPAVVKDVFGVPTKFNTKFDGMPVGSLMPVFKDNTQPDQWGLVGDKLNGDPSSRFPGWIYCDGSYLDPNDYPLLFEVLEYTFGAQGASPIFFRIPDLRNRKLLGTGPVDGTSPSSPAVTPEYGPTKLAGTGGVNIPGSFGGMWFIDTIASPGIDEEEQVAEPGTGQPAQESQFFAIAQLRTTGYENVNGQIQFSTFGQVTAPVSVSETTIFDVPYHIHSLVTGQADIGDFAGRIGWGLEGGIRRVDVGDPNSEGNISGQGALNVWGVPIQGSTIQLTNDDDTVSSNVSNARGAEYWGETIGTYGDCAESTYTGQFWDPSEDPGPSSNTIECLFNSFFTVDCGSPENAQVHGSINVNFPNQGNLRNSLNTFIGEGNSNSIPSSNRTGNNLLWGGALTIPRRFVTVAKFAPDSKNSHSHYLSLTQIQDTETQFSYNNQPGPGTANGVPATPSVNVSFSAADVGLEVFPGTFTLGLNKQLIPVPSFSPNDLVPLVTPYLKVRWLIKAY